MSNEDIKALTSDPEFSRLLEESDQAFRDSQSFFRYEPENGQHDTLIKEIKVGKVEDNKSEKTVVQVRVMVEIISGEEAGQVFDLSGNWGWTARNFVGMKTLVDLLTGKPEERGFVEALGILYEHRGAGVMISTSRQPRPAGKEGDPYVNHRPQHLFDLTPSDPAPAEG